MISIEELRRWAVATEEDDRELLRARAAAESYLRAAGVPETDDPERDMAILQLTVYYFEQRGPGANNAYAPPPPMLQGMILQLRSAPREGDGAR